MINSVLDEQYSATVLKLGIMFYTVAPIIDYCSSMTSSQFLGFLFLYCICLQYRCTFSGLFLFLLSSLTFFIYV
jgi:hypothetical protein